jgi:DNA-binding transcriptional ArsR family regulator
MENLEPIADERLDAMFAALADPTRRAILARLAHGDATVGQLAEPFAMSLPAVSKHLRVLERSGLISRGREAQFRPCHLRPDALGEAAAWIEEHRRVWAERFDALEVHLRTLQSGAAPTADAHPETDPGTERTPRDDRPDD